MEEVVSNATKTKGAEKIHQVSQCEDGGDIHGVLRVAARLIFPVTWLSQYERST